VNDSPTLTKTRSFAQKHGNKGTATYRARRRSQIFTAAIERKHKVWSEPIGYHLWHDALTLEEEGWIELKLRAPGIVQVRLPSDHGLSHPACM
jgi:hypothetical protein